MCTCIRFGKSHSAEVDDMLGDPSLVNNLPRQHVSDAVAGLGKQHSEKYMQTIYRRI